MDKKLLCNNGEGLDSETLARLESLVTRGSGDDGKLSVFNRTTLFTQEVWFRSEVNETELRVLVTGSTRLTVSRVQFVQTGQGIMSAVAEVLEDFAKQHGLESVFVQSVCTAEMARWCTGHGYVVTDSTACEAGGFMAGDYMKSF